jgi:SAM-dependent methyltransferase
MSTAHTQTVVDHFTKLADAFGAAEQLTDSQSLCLLLQAANASRTDSSLDVACGAGVVACHFARSVRAAEGIDITPAMLTKARERQRREGLTNVKRAQGDVTKLPYLDRTFTVVTSRYVMRISRVRPTSLRPAIAAWEQCAMTFFIHVPLVRAFGRWQRVTGSVTPPLRDESDRVPPLASSDLSVNPHSLEECCDGFRDQARAYRGRPNYERFRIGRAPRSPLRTSAPWLGRAN